MKGKSKFFKILLISITTVISLLFIFCFIQRQNSIKQEQKKLSQIKEITTQNITSPIHDILTDIFKIEDSLDSDTFWQSITSKCLPSFVDAKDFDNSIGLCRFNLLDHLFNQIAENANKKKLKTSIKLQKAYDLNDNKYEVKFIVERESNTKNNSNTIKTQEYYDAKFIYKSNKLYLYEIYDINDFNYYIQKHKIQQCFLTRDRLLYKYLEFKQSLYNDLSKHHIRKDWFKSSGYSL